MRATIWSKVANVLVVGANRSATSAVISAYVIILWGGRGLIVDGRQRLLSVDPCGRVCSFFGEAIPEAGISIFTQASAHPIYELEILPVVVGVACWKEFICNKQVVFYIDNSAAQAAFIGATGATDLASKLVDIYVQLECQSCFFPWFGRVPSHSNISDPASRLEVNHPLLPEAFRLSVDVFSHLSNWGLASGAR